LDSYSSPPPADINEFTNEIFVAEGLDPQYEPRDLYRRVKEIIVDSFERHDAAESDECVKDPKK
jgi:hypothetical protein